MDDGGRGGGLCVEAGSRLVVGKGKEHIGTLQGHNTENSKQIFPGKELRGYTGMWKLGLRQRSSFSGNT
jgi:hypothetical protein